MGPWERWSCSRSTGVGAIRSSPRCGAWSRRSAASIRSFGDGRAAWRPRSSGSSSSSRERSLRACRSRRPTAPSDSPTSSSILLRRGPDPRLRTFLPRVYGRERYREVAAGGAEPTRESCRGRHAQAPGPREARRPEQDADETPDTCSSRSSTLRTDQYVSRTTFRPHDVAPSVESAARQPESIGTKSSDSSCSKPAPGWMPSSCRASVGTKASQSAMATFG